MITFDEKPNQGTLGVQFDEEQLTAKIKVIGVGGVTCLDDVLDFLAVGALAVGVGTASFADPDLPIRLVVELTAECRRRGLDSYRPLIGTALPKRKLPSSVRAAEYRP